MKSDRHPSEEDHEPEWSLPPDGLRLAFMLDGQGGGAPIDWYNVERWSQGEGILWLQVDTRHEPAMANLRESELLTADDLQTLLNSPPRATVRPVGDRAMIFSARGFGPEGELVAGPAGIARVWFAPNVVLGLLEYDVAGTEEVCRMYREGRGPRDGAELMVWYMKLLSDRFFAMAAALEARMAGIEVRQPLRSEALKQVHAEVLQLHRHLAPHKVMASRAVSLADSAFIGQHIELWRDICYQDIDTDQLLRTLQQRSLAVHHYASEQFARRINAAALVLAFVSTIALPLTLVAAVLSMDVAIPGSSYPWLETLPAALSIVVVMVLLMGLTALVVRRCRPFRQSSLAEGGRAAGEARC